MKYRVIFVAAVALLFAGAFVFLARGGGLTGAPRGDEVGFWKASLWFSDGGVTLEKLRSYPSLNTPLPFFVWGTLERLTGQGLPMGRLLNVIIAFWMTVLVGLAGRSRDRIAIAAAVGLLLFPHFLLNSVRLYTDIMAAAFVLLGVLAWTRKWHVSAAIAFALGIATRQYMLAFPVAVALNELIQRRRFSVAWIAPACAAATILGWYAIYGGHFGPETEITRQKIETAGLFALRPDHGLHQLAVVGLCFVLLEMFLMWRPLSLRALRRPGVIAAIVVVWALFLLYPPISNVTTYHSHEHFGMTDRIVRMVVPGPFDVDMPGPSMITIHPRVVLYALLATLPFIRFPRLGLPLLMIVFNALILMKAHIGWDKYALALLAGLWFLSGDGSADGDAPADASVRDTPPNSSGSP
jgi:hypothetical protein